MPKNQHVVPHADGWAVQGDGNSRATSIHSTQKDAIDAAREIAKKPKIRITDTWAKWSNSRKKFLWK